MKQEGKAGWYETLRTDLPFGLKEDSVGGVLGTASAIALQLAVIAVIVVVLQVDIFLRNWNDLSNSIHVVYVTAITVLATVVTAYTTGPIRRLWFRRCTIKAASSTNARDRSFRVITGLGSFVDELRDGDISFTFIVVAFVTASIVTCLSPRSVIVTSASSQSDITTRQDHLCVNDLAQRSTAGKWFNWRLNDGSYIGLDQNLTQTRRYCVQRYAVDSLVTGLSDSKPWDTAYILGDILIHRSAVGMPFDRFFGLDYVFGTTRNADFQWAARCLPVLTKNPVRCVPGAGTVRYSDTNNTISVQSEDCSVESKSLRVVPSSANAAVLGACTNNKSIGTATILIGAVNEFPNRSRDDGGLSYHNYASILQTIVGGTGRITDRSYAVTCSLDLPSVINLRMLNYSRSEEQAGLNDAANHNVLSGYGYQVAANDNNSCTMHHTLSGTETDRQQLLTPAVLANGVGSVWPVLAENTYDDGWFDTLNYLTSQRGGVFSDSTNDLEDALGTIIAVGTGFYWMAWPERNDTVLPPGLHAYRKIRLGPNSTVGYLYLLPSVFAIVLLSWLSQGTWHLSRRKESSNYKATYSYFQRFFASLP